MVSTKNVHIDNVMKTPQFWQLWTTFSCIAGAGVGVISVAKTMMSEIFANALPLIVTGTFASAFIMAISAANLGGRVFWATMSDKIGRKAVFAIFTGVSIPLYFAIPYYVGMVTSEPSVLPLALFYGSSLSIISFFGGTCKFYFSFNVFIYFILIPSIFFCILFLVSDFFHPQLFHRRLGDACLRVGLVRIQVRRSCSWSHAHRLFCGFCFGPHQYHQVAREK